VRIIAGEWAERQLKSPGARVRPTTEEVRGFWLERWAPHLDGARVLDVFAGSGALGLEALSRGAAWADFVEFGPMALHALKANVMAERLRPPKRDRPPTRRHKAARVFKRDAIPFVQGLTAGTYDLAFADPPYGSRKLDRVVERWLEVPFATRLGVEHASDHAVPPGGVTVRFDTTSVTFYE
jgi:16S rRNA (guanine966-N2)-methyltransferase